MRDIINYLLDRIEKLSYSKKEALRWYEYVCKENEKIKEELERIRNYKTRD